MFQRNKYKSHTDKAWHSIEDPVASIKYDGASFFLQFEADGTPKYYSRRESVKGGFPEKSNRIPHLANVKLPQFANHVYNVELIHTGSHPNNVESHPILSGIMNSLPERAINTQKELGPVRAVLLSTINPPPKNYIENIKQMKAVEQAFNKPGLIFTPQYHQGKANIVRLIANTKAAGREGVIVTSLSNPESKNVRVKVKHLDTYNLVVTGITQEMDKNGNPKDSAGALVVCDGKGREVASVGTGLSADLRKQIWHNKSAWMGKLIQVKTMGVGGSDKMGRLRMPVYNGEADGELDIV